MTTHLRFVIYQGVRQGFPISSSKRPLLPFFQEMSNILLNFLFIHTNTYIVFTKNKQFIELIFLHLKFIKQNYYKNKLKSIAYFW